MITSFSRGLSALQARLNYRIPIILAITLLAFLLGLRALPKHLFWLVLALGSGLAYVALTRRLEWGLFLLAPVSILVPVAIGTGTSVPLNLALLFSLFLFFVWLARMLFIQREVRLVPSRLNRPVILFILAATVSLLIGNFPVLIKAPSQASLPAQFGGYLMFVLSLGMLLLVANNLTELRWLKAITYFFLGFGAVYTVLGINFGLTVIASAYFQNGVSTSIFWIFLAVISFGQGLFNREWPLAWRVAAIGVTLASIYLGWRGREWLAGWIPPLIGIYVLIWLRSWKLGLLVTIAGAVFLIPEYPRLFAEINTDTQQWSTYTRWLTWSMMAEIVKASPIFGVGFANPYHYSILFSYGGYFVNLNSHNNYWDIATQTGLLGLVLFIWIVVELALLGWRLRKRVNDGFSQAYVNSVLAGFVAMLASGMMADWFLPFLYNIGLPGFRTSIIAWLFLGGLLSLEVMTRRENPGKPVHAPAQEPAYEA